MKLTIALGAATAGNLLLGFFIQWAIIATLGPGIETDSYFASVSVPQVFLALFASALVNVIVPILAGEEAERQRRDGWTIFVFVCGIFALIALLLGLSCGAWVPLIFPGFSDEARELTARLIRIQLAAVVMNAGYGVLRSVANARRHFIWPELVPFAGSVVALAALVWLLPGYGIVAAAWITLVRFGIPMILLVPELGSFRGVLISSSKSVLLKLWDRIKHLLLGTLYFKTDPLLDRFLASMAPVGMLSLFSLASQTFGAASQIVNRSLATPAVTMMSEAMKRGDSAGFIATLRRRLLAVSILSIAIFLGVVFAGLPILRLVAPHDRVSDEQVRILWLLLIALGGLLVFGSIGQISSSAFYAVGDTKTPSRLGMVTYTIWIPLKIIAFTQYGVMGLAVATSGYYAFSALWQLAILRKRQGTHR